MIVVIPVGIDQAIAVLGRDLTAALAALTAAVAAEIEDKVAPYPPATSANQAKTEWTKGGPNSWYIRGQGAWWIRKDKTTNHRETSEQLGQRWGISQPIAGAHTTSIVNNNATYAQYLHDNENRVEWAKARGWVSDKEAIDKVVASGVIEEMAADMVEQVYNSG